jgi:hypothetical protein
MAAANNPVPSADEVGGVNKDCANVMTTVQTKTV